MHRAASHEATGDLGYLSGDEDRAIAQDRAQNCNEIGGRAANGEVRRRELRGFYDLLLPSQASRKAATRQPRRSPGPASGRAPP